MNVLAGSLVLYLATSPVFTLPAEAEGRQPLAKESADHIMASLEKKGLSISNATDVPTSSLARARYHPRCFRGILFRAAVMIRRRRFHTRARIRSGKGFEYQKKSQKDMMHAILRKAGSTAGKY
jgi:hypothetical protein